MADNNETHDRLLGGRVAIRQPTRGYRVSIDAVLLAASVETSQVGSVLDVGCGDGGATLCLAWRAPEIRLCGIDVRSDALERFSASVTQNGWENRITGLLADVGAGTVAQMRDTFDQVISNPPYLPVERMDRRMASGEPDPATTETVPLSHWIAFMLSSLRDGGRLNMVHRADRLEDILTAVAGQAGEIEIYPIWPRAGAAAKRVIVSARKGVRGPSRLLSGLVLHDDDGAFTPAARAIFEDGAPLNCP